MSRVLTVLVLLLSATVAQANSGPPPVRCEREVKLATVTDGYAFFTLRVAEKNATLEAIALSTDRRVTLPIRVEGRAESAVELYCVTTDDVKRLETADQLLAAIRGDKVPHSTLKFGTTARSFFYMGLDPSSYCRTREVIAVDKAGKMTATSAVIEPAPAPRKLSRLTLIGTFAALSLVASGFWLRRRK